MPTPPRHGATPVGDTPAATPAHPTRAFDEHHPPDAELISDCVHCGFCLPASPTYALWGEEMDSPRGRIYLMSLAEQGEIGLDGPFAQHIDACLDCSILLVNRDLDRDRPRPPGHCELDGHAQHVWYLVGRRRPKGGLAHSI